MEVAYGQYLLFGGQIALAAYIVVVTHEMAHFWVAQCTSVRVLDVSFGKGPIAARWRLHDKPFALHWLPAGGGVGMADEGGVDSLSMQPKWQRLMIILAGPLANVVLGAIIIAVGVSLSPDLLDQDVTRFIYWREWLIGNQGWTLVMCGGYSFLIGLFNLVVPWPGLDGWKALDLLAEGLSPARIVLIGLIIVAVAETPFILAHFMTS